MVCSRLFLAPTGESKGERRPQGLECSGRRVSALHGCLGPWGGSGLGLCYGCTAWCMCDAKYLGILQDQAERPAKRQRPEWIDPPEGTTLFQISMEKLHSKPVKGRRTLKQLDDMIEFGDPEETLREEKVDPETLRPSPPTLR